MSDFWSDPSSTSRLMCANSECSGETAQMHRLAWTFAGRLGDKYHKLMSWLIFHSPKSCKSNNSTIFKYWDRYVCEGAVWSMSTLFAISPEFFDTSFDSKTGLNLRQVTIIAGRPNAWKFPGWKSHPAQKLRIIFQSPAFFKISLNFSILCLFLRVLIES